MRALCWYGKEDVRVEQVPDPTIEDPRDAIVKVTSCAICGSDLHLYDHFMVGLEKGDVLGHEFMGEVVEVGKGVNGKLKVGERVVVPFTIYCGECDQCRKGNFSVCERSNRKKENADKMFGHTTAGLFGYTHLTGGYSGGQAEYVRVPFADCTHIKVPENLTDEQVLFLGDIFPTGWQAAAQCEIESTDTVAIWGCGPVGQFAIRSAILLNAKQVIAIDRVPERLAMAQAAGATTINFETQSVVEILNDLTQGKGPEKCIDAVGMEAHVSSTLDSVVDRAKQAMMMETDRPHVLREMRGRAVTPRRLLPQRVQHDVIEIALQLPRVRRFPNRLARRRGRFFANHPENFLAPRMRTGKAMRTLAGEHLIKQCAERIDIARGRHIIPSRLLRRGSARGEMLATGNGRFLRV